MRISIRTAVAVIALTGIASAACNKSATLVTPDPVVTTETFTGTINPLGSASHTFTVNYTYARSDAAVTVNSLTSVATGAAQSITIGIGFGQINAGVCTRAAGYTNVAAPLNTQLATSGTPFAAGTFCVQIFDNPDAPTVTEPLTYSIAVKHI